MRTIFCYFLISFFTYSHALSQDVKNEPCIIVYISEKIKDGEESPLFNNKYCIIPLSKLKNLYVDTSCLGCIIYQISKSGGYLIHINQDSYIYACCKTGDIKTSIYDVVANDSEQINKLVRVSSDKITLKKRHAKLIKINVVSSGKIFKFKFRIWKGNVDYCICDAYMEGTLGSVSNKLAYVVKMNNSKKINRKEYSWLRNFILGIVEF